LTMDNPTQHFEQGSFPDFAVWAWNHIVRWTWKRKRIIPFSFPSAQRALYTKTICNICDADKNHVSPSKDHRIVAQKNPQKTNAFSPKKLIKLTKIRLFSNLNHICTRITAYLIQPYGSTECETRTNKGIWPPQTLRIQPNFINFESKIYLQIFSTRVLLNLNYFLVFICHRLLTSDDQGFVQKSLINYSFNNKLTYRNLSIRTSCFGTW
jgi:hypothetical protein